MAIKKGDLVFTKSELERAAENIRLFEHMHVKEVHGIIEFDGEELFVINYSFSLEDGVKTLTAYPERSLVLESEAKEYISNKIKENVEDQIDEAFEKLREIKEKKLTKPR